MTSLNAPELPMISRSSFTREYALCAEKPPNEYFYSITKQTYSMLASGRIYIIYIFLVVV